MTTASYFVGDVFKLLERTPDNSIDLVLTSPPFLAQRSYLPDDHPAKHRELGSEGEPVEFVRMLLELTVALRRVLSPWGSLVVELGDTYAARARGDRDERRGRAGMRTDGGRYPDGYSGGSTGHDVSGSAPAFEVRPTQHGAWPLDKSLAMIPELYRCSLAYGRNMLDPTQQLEPWRVRNVVRWIKPNPPPGALGDKFRNATSDVVIACTDRRRFFDMDAVRTEHTEPEAIKRRRKDFSAAHPGTGWEADAEEIVQNAAGAPPLDWWLVPPDPYAGAHFATWPRGLCLRPIESMCPRHVCRQCGEPRRRIAETTNAVGHAVARGAWMAGATGSERTDWTDVNEGPKHVERVTHGWTDCGHDDYRLGRVLDPFAGSGTTLAVATGCGREAIGFDLDERNVHMARERVGLMLTERMIDELDGLAS